MYGSLSRSKKYTSSMLRRASATSDKRPEFLRMVELATDGTDAFDCVVVHSLSRFFRDSFGMEFYVRRLSAHGVRLLSVTQELGNDPTHDMVRKFIAICDEHQSRENAKHVLRSMKENARQGFWNGARPPFRYKTVEAERRGARIKKKLEIDNVEAEVVRRIFDVCENGDGASGPMGVKAVVCWLNERGYRTRQGSRWGIGPLHHLLTNPIYAVRMQFNRKEARSRSRKDASEIVEVVVPAIIEGKRFDDVQGLLRSRNPKVTPPRVVTGPILLTGMAVCAACGAGMTLRTGTSRTGAVHRYYSCSARGRIGPSACPGLAVPMQRLDSLVCEHLASRQFSRDRLTMLIGELEATRAADSAAVDRRLQELQREVVNADDALRRLYRLIEIGDTEPDEILLNRIAVLRGQRERAQAAAERSATGRLAQAPISEARIDEFGDQVRKALCDGDIPFRKAYLRSIVDRVEVARELVRIIGRKSSLESALRAPDGRPPPVHSLVREWRTR